ncbi:MAG: hypothetical protein AAB316_15460 [Bacteroidota bacterium]
MIFWNCLLAALAFAQTNPAANPYDTLTNDERIVLAAQARKDLADGYLIVRLNTNKNKIEALKKQLAQPNLSGQQRERLQKMLETTQQETTQNNRWLAEAFQAHYDFSKFIFMPDTASATLKKGMTKGIFLNANLQPDASIDIAGKPYFIAAYGTSSNAGASGTEGLAILDKNFHELPSPFPHFNGLTGIRKIFSGIFGGSSEADFYQKLVLKLNKKLREH